MSQFVDENMPTGPVILPVLPLRDIVVFPYMVAPLFVGRPQSIGALEKATDSDKYIFLVSQKDPKVDNPAESDLYSVGTIGKVTQLLKLPDGTVKVLVEGCWRAGILDFYSTEEMLQAEVSPQEEALEETAEVAALMRAIKTTFESYVSLSKKLSPEVSNSVAGIDQATRLADTVVGHLQVPLADKQDILELLDPMLRLEQILALLEQEIEILQIEGRIRSRVKSQMERSQKEYYLNEQMRAIQKELGEKDEFKQEILHFEEQIKKKKMSKEATDKARAELRKLKMMSPMSAEATVVRNYIEWLLSLPWKKGTKDCHDLVKAEEILEADHYGLEKVKERVLEYLAVQALVKQIKGPILCLVGPPGVGKTSLGQSIAKALNRKFIRMSLGGVRDEAEIRGHRRTYIGAMPGKIIQGLKKSGVKNPVFMLDEIDKMSTDFRGDPSSALLEVLDPEQNNSFVDHFLDVDYDLSQVLFVATANNLQTIPRPLHDRLEVIRVEGYSEEEKLHIARRYLLKKQSTAHGLAEEQAKFSDRALYEIIRRYTRESGVRSLDRNIASVMRKLAKRALLEGKEKSFSIGESQIKKYLGVPQYQYGVREEEDQVGMATGLAWTETGGELLVIEVTVLPGNGKLTITGKLGEVMQESAQAAMSYVRSRWKELDLKEEFYSKLDIHIHVPEGAVPKDGPSAGITMATALASALTGRPVRKDLAMTGEVTLRGRVLMIGGLKEKLLAARRGGIKKILIPADNEKYLVELPAQLTRSVEVVKVSHMDQVLAEAITGMKVEK
ncbi:ATP-dependent proteinase. Serine peptidase. MEROPS family S16 [Malonomonas rubra DSM 5091]|uniref:Lon protease n=1 Tax=Malonomonas rubra DSM 5091 TaxID=1122189 RepID=A0A1M6BF82_MALRU|nr:endopeptidase La [Malonomonas rubra]SHI47327.1 ATP-dependent proteinase. Serine peptidase. MEROPS family S16 [Malonomonas rubra DSM 5091]